jgi:hypothetical protein
MKFSKGVAMTGASKILVAYNVAIGLSALICAPAGAQPSTLALGSQPAGNTGHPATISITARPLFETPFPSANPALGGQTASPSAVITRAQLPGHWALHGSNDVWVPTESRLRDIQTAAVVQGTYVWRNGAYVWVPKHYTNP